MKAVDFEYAGRTLSSFGMMICSFGDKGLETLTNGSTITFNTVSTLDGAKHYLTSANYEECLTTTIQICKGSCASDVTEISPLEFRELTKWLSRKKFLKFKIFDENYIDLYYEVSFNISRIELDGRLYGLELEAFTNRPFALKEPKTMIIRTRKIYTWGKFNVVNEYEKEDTEIPIKYVTSYNESLYPKNGIRGNYFYIYDSKKDRLDNEHSIDDISYEEGHIYPYTEITIDESGDLEIYNALEDRKTYIANCKKGEVITMDYPLIQTSDSSHKIQNDFNWNFFRIANTYDNSRNDLTVSLPCTIKLTYSPIVKVGL